MFNGIIELDTNYHTMMSINSIFTVIENFKKKFNLKITDIKKETDSKVQTYVFELEQTRISFISKQFKYNCEIITDELDFFCEIHNYLKYYLTDYDFKIGDTVFYNCKQYTITNIMDDNYIEVVSGDKDDKPHREYKCWGMRLN